ncbi:MAG: ASCH domain-containing protein [Clostridia bacterium]|nr:ASCH domain-containing protein [Clostridia bacterium]
MKALTVKQPYASLIWRGEKTVEWRSWATAHRGDLLICSGALWADGEYDVPDESLHMFPTGCALCVVRLADVVSMSEVHLDAAVMEEMPNPQGYAWLIDRVRETERVKVRGKPGLFEV